MSTERGLCDEIVAGKRILTTDKDKMYNLYVLDGHSNTVKEVEDNDLYDFWFDHCVLPSFFVELAKRLNCEYSAETFSFIKEEYETNYLRSN